MINSLLGSCQNNLTFYEMPVAGRRTHIRGKAAKHKEFAVLPPPAPATGWLRRASLDGGSNTMVTSLTYTCACPCVERQVELPASSRRPLCCARGEASVILSLWLPSSENGAARSRSEWKKTLPNLFAVREEARKRFWYQFNRAACSHWKNNFRQSLSFRFRGERN